MLGWWWADPAAALVIAAVAVKEGGQAWRGDGCCAPREEPYRRRTHWHAYIAYAARVGRFLPEVGTGRPPAITVAAGKAGRCGGTS